MKIVILGGNSQKNISWTELLQAELNKFYKSVLVHRYAHWDTGEPVINLEKELGLVKETLNTEEKFVIVAKSAGVLLTLKGICEKKIHPTACIFLGTAISWGREQGFEVNSWIKSLSVPTLFIHQLNDPAISSSELENVLKSSGLENYQLKVIPGDNHQYSEVQEITQFIKDFLDKSGLKESK